MRRGRNMGIGTASGRVLESIFTRWDSELDATVRAKRSDQSLDWDTVYDTKAEEGVPFPYVTFEQTPAGVLPIQQSWSDDEGRAIRGTDVRFTVHARDKDDACELSEAIQAAYDKWCDPLSRGNLLVMRQLADWGLPQGRDEYIWVVDYRITYDAVTN